MEFGSSGSQTHFKGSLGIPRGLRRVPGVSMTVQGLPGDINKVTRKS